MTVTDKALAPVNEIPERWSYRAKRRLLGAPLVTANLHEEKLSKKAALGVLSSDCISSSAYGSEEMLIYLLAAFGLTGFQILLPMTGVVLVVLILMTLSYREVVMVYTKAGGSYVVARENFGPKVAQIASVALMIDYIVTVAVQAAAGTAAISSHRAESVAGTSVSLLLITIGVVLLILAYGNLRGVREAGKLVRVADLSCSWSPRVARSSIVGVRARDLRRPADVIAHEQSAGCITHARRPPRDLHLRSDLRAAQGLRERRLIADRTRSDLERRQRVQEAPRASQRPANAVGR